MIFQPRRAPAALLLAAILAGTGCAASMAYRKGKGDAKRGEWDLAVARFTKALAKSPDNITYKIALESARVQASRHHAAEAQKHLHAQDLDKAAEELQIAANFDPANKSASDDLKIVKEKIRKRDEERDRLGQFEETRARAAAARVPVPVLSARSQQPISLKFADQSLQKILEALGKLAGVNVVFDGEYRDKRSSIELMGVTFEEALNQITLTNKLYYKVVDQNTVIIAADTPQKRKAYDDNLVRTFYIQNAEIPDTVALLKAVGPPTMKAQGNAVLGAITVAGTPDELAIAERIIALNDKARGEVMVEVNILEVNRTRLKDYGIQLSNYGASVTFSPTGRASEVAGGLTSVRAHLLSSLNLSDFVVSIPSALLSRFLQTDSTVKIIAAPRLRAAEGKKTSLKIGTEVPIPVTTFTANAQGGNQSFLPATSFQYRNVGVNLELTPKVNVSGDVFLELQAEFSLLGDDRNVGSTGNPLIVPTFLTRNVTGVLRLHDGETSLIGGLIQGRDSDSFRGALGLQSIPILNKLFTSAVRQDDETEVIISITPHLVRAPKVTEDDLHATHIGTKDVPRVLSVRPSLFAEATPETPAPEAKPVPSPAPPVEPAPVPTPSPSAASPPPSTDLPTAAPSAAPTAASSPTASSATAPGSTPGIGRVLWSPSELRIKAGETASLSLVLVGGRAVTGVDMQLATEGTSFEIVDVSPGTLLTLDGSAIGTERQASPGRYVVRFTRPQPATGSGAVAVLRVKGAQAGSGSVLLQSVSVLGAADSPAAPGPVQVVVEP